MASLARQIKDEEIEIVPCSARQTAIGPTRSRTTLSSLRHGIFAESLVLPGESRTSFDRLARQFYEELDPKTQQELCLVQDIIAAHWRMRRMMAIERERLANLIDCGATHVEAARLLAGDSKLDNYIHRMETRLQRTVVSNTRLLLDLRERRRRMRHREFTQVEAERVISVRERVLEVG